MDASTSTKGATTSGAASLGSLNIALPRENTTNQRGLATDNAHAHALPHDESTKLKAPKDLNLGMNVGISSTAMNNRLNTSVNSDVASSMNYLLEQPQPGTLVNNRLISEPSAGPVNVTTNSEQMLNSTSHMDPAFSLPTDNSMGSTAAHSSTATQPQLQATPAISTGGSTNFQVQIAQRLADIDQRVLRMEMLLDNMCNKIDAQTRQQSLCKSDIERMEHKFTGHLTEIKDTITFLKRNAGTQREEGFTTELLHAIGTVSNKYMKRQTDGFPGSQTPRGTSGAPGVGGGELGQQNIGYNNMQMSGIGDTMSYVPGEHANLNQLGSSKEHIDRFLTKSATEFMLDPSGLKKRRKNPSNEGESLPMLQIRMNHQNNLPINYSASLPNLNLDALSKDMLSNQQSTNPHGSTNTSLLRKNIRFGISSSSSSSSSSGENNDDDEEEEEEEEEYEDAVEADSIAKPKDVNASGSSALLNNNTNGKDSTEQNTAGITSDNHTQANNTTVSLQNQTQSVGSMVNPPLAGRDNNTAVVDNNNINHKMNTDNNSNSNSNSNNNIASGSGATEVSNSNGASNAIPVGVNAAINGNHAVADNIKDKEQEVITTSNSTNINADANLKTNPSPTPKSNTDRNDKDGGDIPVISNAPRVSKEAAEKLKLVGSKKEPRFTMLKAPSSVEEIWKEYTTGIDGRPSIRSLDQKFGSKWRANKNKKTYSRRKRMYKFILNGVNNGRSEEEMIKLLENKRLYKDTDGKQKKRTIGWLQQSLSGI